MRAIVIIGAARSGTNMLRDVLTQMPGFCTWPCDEINYIWRHGNRGFPTDEFRAEHARPEVCEYIQTKFEKLARKRGAEAVVEKTCANSLRIEFVNRVLPDSRFIFITRDGRDVVASASRRWRAPLELAYILAKARYIPLTDIWYYASRYAINRLHRLASPDRRLAYWGPRFAGFEDEVTHRSLPEIAALQWARCVEKSLDAFENCEPSRVHRICYEQMVRNPVEEISSLAKFLEINVRPIDVARIAKGISASSAGKWKQELDSQTMKAIEPHLDTMLKRLGYV